MFTMIIVVVGGSSNKRAVKMPTGEQITAIITPQIRTPLKVFDIRIADSTGKIIREALSSEPSRLMEIAITTPVITDNKSS
jgi:hypothetical protein